MCEAFLEAGVHLELVVPDRKTDVQSVKDFYGLRTDISLKRLGVLPLYAFGRFGFFLGSLSFAVRYFFYLGWKHWVRGEKFIIYTTDLDQFSFFLIPFLGMPYFVEMHDAKKWSWRFAILLRRAQSIVVINEIIKRELVSVFRIPEKKILVYPNGFDRNAFQEFESISIARERLDLPLDAKIVMYVGRSYGWKGLDTLLRCAELMPGVAFYFIGATSDELQKAAHVKCPQNFTCLGGRKFQDIPHWLWAADVLVVSGTKRDDYSYYHTSPMKMFEYAAARRPILASRTPAIEQIFSDKEVFFHEPDSAIAMRDCVRSIFDPHNAEDVKKRCTAAYQKILLFAWDTRAERIIDFMKNAL